MYLLFPSTQYKKSLKKLERSGKINRKKLDQVVDLLQQGKSLPKNYRDHALRGDLKEYRECHIQGDLLLVYKIENDQLILVLIDIGSHSQLFG